MPSIRGTVAGPTTAAKRARPRKRRRRGDNIAAAVTRGDHPQALGRRRGDVLLARVKGGFSEAGSAESYRWPSFCCLAVLPSRSFFFVLLRFSRFFAGLS